MAAQRTVEDALVDVLKEMFARISRLEVRVEALERAQIAETHRESRTRQVKAQTIKLQGFKGSRVQRAERRAA